MSALGLVGGALLLIVLAIVRSLVVDEAKGRLWDLSGALVHRAVMRQPESHRDEKRKEWMGELDAQRGKPLSALRWSWNLYRSRRSTAHELRADRESTPLWAPEPKAPKSIAAEPLHPHLQAAVDLAKRFGWQDILAAMGDPGLAEVEKPLGEATDRFCATIAECRSGPDLVLGRYGPYFDRDTGRRFGPLMQDDHGPSGFRISIPRELRLKSAPAAVRSRRLELLGYLLTVLVFLFTFRTYPHAPFVVSAILAAGVIAQIRGRRGRGHRGVFAPVIVMLAGFDLSLPLLLGVGEGVVLFPLILLLGFVSRRGI